MIFSSQYRISGILEQAPHPPDQSIMRDGLEILANVQLEVPCPAAGGFLRCLDADQPSLAFPAG